MELKKAHQDCVFCRELAGSRDTNFGRRYPELASRVIGQSNSLVAFPCIGQIMPGHFLVVPKQHDATFRDASIRLMELQIELQALLEQVHKRIGAHESESLYFEHGARNVTDGGCGIYHAHLHVVPNAGHIPPNLLFSFDTKTPNLSLEEAWMGVPGGESYVLVGSADHGFFSQPLEQPLPSQTLRRSVAATLKTDTWDWRQYGREDAMLAILAMDSTQ
ncbi:hypothetical protein D8I24_1223 [Cupriavidus necator H850]|uniref:HIT family protein n=1 Tax=Cupriavidus necator TaxID=106590 RepID=UPI00129D318D|nr:HIT family protein [Cupriavidus necator]KAI3608385.1 hypothetical protein D8I24_1223 [Cupriavidus necator H850]